MSTNSVVSLNKPNVGVYVDGIYSI